MSLPAGQFRVLGGESFASPGTSDEKLRFCCAQADLSAASAGSGDGSVMEEGASLVELDLSDAIEACRSGAIPDMKTELGLLRLADHLGYLRSCAASSTSSRPPSPPATPDSASLRSGDPAPRPRIGILGAGRRRQGLGPFVARDLVAAGAEIAGFVVTSAASLDAVTRAWACELGIQARGHLELSSLLRAEQLDALAILSPAETHEPALEAALEAGLHVLCEKPFVWGRPELAATARRLALGFDTRGLLLWENCQWPYVLPAFERLHPGSLAGRRAGWRCGSSPLRRGVQMLGDSVPHVLSLIQALLPGGAGLIDGCASGGSARLARLELGFRFCRRPRAGGRDRAAAQRPPSARRPSSKSRTACRASGRRRWIPAILGRRRPHGAAARSADAARRRLRRRASPPGERATASRSLEIAERMELLERIVTAFTRQAPGEAAP